MPNPTRSTSPQVHELRSSDGLCLRLMDQGATWLSCTVPLGDGSRREVLLGCADPGDYLGQNAYLGATVGRYANRIAQGRIEHGGDHWSLDTNPGSPHHLHGGPDGFDRRRWTVETSSDTEVRYRLASEAGDQGYPGRLQARVSYRLLPRLTIEMDCEAVVSAPSPVCLTQHAYFNLDPRHDDVRGHRLRILSDRYLPVDEQLIPLGMLSAVDGTGFDFRTGKTLMQDWLRDPQQQASGGYDHAYLLSHGGAHLHAAEVVLSASDGRLSMQLHSTLPSLQLYTGQGLGGIVSRDGTPYAACAGVALEPQFLPDSPNHPEWPQPSCWLLPGQIYRQRTLYQFSPG